MSEAYKDNYGSGLGDGNIFDIGGIISNWENAGWGGNNKEDKDKFVDKSNEAVKETHLTYDKNAVTKSKHLDKMLDKAKDMVKQIKDKGFEKSEIGKKSELNKPKKEKALKMPGNKEKMAEAKSVGKKMSQNMKDKTQERVAKTKDSKQKIETEKAQSKQNNRQTTQSKAKDSKGR